MVWRQLELSKAVPVRAGPVDSRSCVVDGGLAIDPELNAAGRRIRCSANFDAACEFHPLVRNEVEAGWIQRCLIVRARIVT